MEDKIKLKEEIASLEQQERQLEQQLWAVRGALAFARRIVEIESQESQEETRGNV